MMDLCRVEIVGVWVNVNEDRLSAYSCDCACCGNKGKRCGDDLITRAYSRSKQCQDQSVSSGSASHREPASYMSGNLRFQVFHFRPQHKSLGFQNMRYGLHY